MTSRTRMVLALGAAALTVGCSSAKHTAVASGPLRLTSPAFTEGQLIPIRYSCASDNVSPPLAWTDPPSGTVEEVVVMEDLDASYIHWVLSGIKPSVHALAAATVPPKAVISRATNGAATYYGPCPPSGSVHHYRITLYALSKQVGITKDTPATQAVSDLAAHVTATATLSGRFGR